MASIRGGLVGYGFIASRGHAPVYARRQDVDIVAIADICAPRLTIAREELKDVRLYRSAEELIAREADNLDFIDIATPPVFHAAIAAQAIERGLHVLCEKPLTASSDDARRLIGLAKKNRRVLFPCHNYRHAPVVKTVREVLDSGRIGKVTAASLSTFRNSHAKGVREWHQDWRRELQYSGGGIGMDHGSHTFYLCFDWLGAYPTAISAKATSRTSDKYDTEDNLTATLTFPTGTANVSLSWTSGIRKVVYVVQGERGAVMVDDDDLQIVLQETKGNSVTDRQSMSWATERRSIASCWIDASHTQWFDSLFSDFRRAIVCEDFAGRDAHDALKCIQVIEAAYRSAQAHCLEVPIGEPDQR
jgi:predicted dehydrogenase